MSIESKRDAEAISYEENRSPFGLSPEDQSFLDNLPEKDKKLAVRKVD